jgi:hypothetical protein
MNEREFRESPKRLAIIAGSNSRDGTLTLFLQNVAAGAEFFHGMVDATEILELRLLMVERVRSLCPLRKSMIMGLI